ncbi:MAG TPA: universal stress protein, partial [Yinghuangia sp.]|nr:universal stress protein [Yinghuangia sp.]
MNLQLSRPPAPAVPVRGRLSAPQPVAAVLADRLDDVAVAETAARIAASRGVPLLLIAVLPPAPVPGTRARPDDPEARAVLARVLPRVPRHHAAHIPAVYRRPHGRGTRLGAAAGVLALASHHHAPLVVASRTGPAGLDAFSLIEAAAIRGG